MRSLSLVGIACMVLCSCVRVGVDRESTAVAGKQDTVVAAQAAAAQFGAPITRLAVEFTPAAREQIEGDERFNAEALRDAILAELKSRHLLDLQPTGSGRAAVMQIEEFSVRATSNVVVMGHLASNGLLGGTIRIRDAADGATRQWQVRAEIRMKISRSGTDKNPLKNLYAGFARQLADALTGAAEPDPSPR